MVANSDIRLPGTNGAIYIGGAVGGGGVRVAAKTGYTFSNERDFFDGTAFGDSNKRWFAGVRNAQGTYEGLYDASGDKLLLASNLGPQLIYLYADDNTGGSSIGTYEVAHGSGYLDGSVNVSITDMAKTTGNFRASANWTIFTS